MQQQPQRLDYIVLIKDRESAILKDNIEAASAISSILSSCLGPQALQKMILSRTGMIQMTNDGNAILRELDVAHPAAKTLVDIARTQEEAVGDGTTSVILLAAELFSKVGDVDMHPVRKVKVLKEILDLCLGHLSKIEMKMTEGQRKAIVEGSVNTKICQLVGIDVVELALKSVEMIYKSDRRCDLKNFLRVEKIFMGEFKQSELLEGVLLNKNIIHSQMRRRIENPRVVVLDSPLEYKKGESQTKYEFTSKDAFTRALEIEEEQVLLRCQRIAELKPDIVLTEKGISDFALAYLQSKNIRAIRRLKKSEAVRVARATGSKIVNSADDLDESCVGTKCGIFEYIRIGQEYFCRFGDCKNQGVVTVMLFGPSRDILYELERNFTDALKVSRLLAFSNKILPGCGASEIALSEMLRMHKCNEEEQSIYNAVAEALKIIPLTLARNSGSEDPILLMAELENAHRKGNIVGIDGVNGRIGDVLYEPSCVKTQALKSAFGVVSQLLRVDGIVESCVRK